LLDQQRQVADDFARKMARDVPPMAFLVAFLVADGSYDPCHQ
jgi:hypothetical protein